MKSKTAGQRPHSEFLWSRENYEELVGQGVFGPDDHIELLNGKLITMAPQHSPHFTAISLARVYLDRVYSSEAYLRVQGPLALDERSMPEPDLAVVPGSIRDYSTQHPATALLVVEVSDSSLAYDRGPKLAAYARAGVPEYWIINLVDSLVEIYRGPKNASYEECTTVHPDSTLHPIGQEGHAIAVSELLP